MQRLIAWLTLLAATALPLHAGRLVSGPMLGYIEHKEAAIIVETADASEVAIEFMIKGEPDSMRRVVKRDPWTSPGGTQPMRFVLPLLEMNKAYTYRLLVDGFEVERPYPLQFKTKDQFEWRRGPSNFSFLVGSCSYINDAPFDRPGTPYGKGTGIFKHMAGTGAEFMLWLGDALYFRESDWWSASGIWSRWARDRSHEDFQALYAAMSHYMVWDDHEYGPNNSSKSYPLKADALKAFKAYSGNQTYGEPDNPGVYGSFQFEDAMFIMLDNRYYRDDSTLDQNLHPEKSQYGERQMAWLKNTLANMNEGNNVRHTKFRFICTGGQFLAESDYAAAEDHSQYRREREEILQFIREHEISGIIFLTGDVHMTELRRKEGTLGYPLYELTSSALSAGPHTGRLSDDSSRVEGTAFQDNNFCKVAISGPENDRVATLTCVDRENVVRWTREIRANDLKPAKAASR